MMPKQLLLFSSVFVFTAILNCQKRVNKTTVLAHDSAQTESASVMTASPSNSAILGNVIEIYPTNQKETGNDLCDKYPCFAKVHIINIDHLGSNFHGQFAVDDLIDVYFEYTMSNTESIFPEFKHHNLGLSLNDTFSAELFESNSGPIEYKIKSYQKK